MQSLGIISVNLWQILISLANLLILFFIIKKFLYGPVKKIIAARQAELDVQYSAASEAERSAKENKEAWEEKMKSAQSEADAIIQTATANANQRGEKIIAEAKEKATYIVRQAENEAALERKRAEDDIKYEIVTISSALAEKMLEREINAQDHRELIDSFIGSIGESNGADV